MAIMGWVGAGMDVVDGVHAGQSQVVWLHVWRSWRTSLARGNSLMTPDHTAV